MTEKIENGQYVLAPFGDRLVTVDYIDEILQGISMRLAVCRGSFYLNKDYGSLIRIDALKNPQNEYALAYARQALDDIDGVYVKNAVVEGDSLSVTVSINNEERTVSIKL